MANGTGVLQNGGRKILGMCIAITLAINTPTLFILKEHWDRFKAIDLDLREGTKDRYYRSDHEAYERLMGQRFSNIDFRFERDEQHISQCLDFIQDHHRLDEKYHDK